MSTAGQSGFWSVSHHSVPGLASMFQQRDVEHTSDVVLLGSIGDRRGRPFELVARVYIQKPIHVGLAPFHSRGV